MGMTAGFCTLKAQFIPPDFPFESARFDLVQRRWDFMVDDSEANSKGLNNGLIKLPRAAKFQRYPFVLNVSIKLQRIITHIAVEVMDLSLSQNFFDLDTYFSKRRVLRASKRDLEREISTTVDRDWIFFLAEVSKYKASRWSIFSRLSLNKIRPAESYPFIQS